MYTESSGSVGQIGSIQTGVAVANPSSTPVTVIADLTKIDGTPSGLPTATINVPAEGQISKFANELFPGLPSTGFRGIVRLTAQLPVAVTAVRIRYNERGDFLLTTTPPLNEGATPPAGLVFPHIVSGGGFGTQLVIFGQAGPGNLLLLAQDGTPRPSSSVQELFQ
jgi:hypothetical protein